MLVPEGLTGELVGKPCYAEEQYEKTKASEKESKQNKHSAHPVLMLPP